MCNSASTPIRALRAIGWMLLLVTGASSFIGCSGVASFQDWQYCWANKHRASAAYKSQLTSAERREFGSDYGNGFKKGFYDASTGRGCKTPAIPPPCYWSAKYQSCEGQKCIQNWFRGYQVGAAAAEGEGFPSFHEIPVGPCAPRTNSSGCQGCYSPDYCECGQDCGGQCASGQCSDGVHAGHPSAAMESSYDNGNLPPNAFQSSTSPSDHLPQASFPPVPRASGISDEAVNNEEVMIDESYVTQTACQTSYEELFAKGVGAKPAAAGANAHTSSEQ